MRRSRTVTETALTANQFLKYKIMRQLGYSPKTAMVHRNISNNRVQKIREQRANGAHLEEALVHTSMTSSPRHRRRGEPLGPSLALTTMNHVRSTAGSRMIRKRRTLR